MADVFSLPQLAGQGTTLQKAQNLFGISPESLAQFGELKTKYNLSSDDLLSLGLFDRLSKSGDPAELERKAQLGYDLQLKAAKEAQKLGKESLAYTSMMNQINNLPGTIASAFGGAGERELTERLYGQIPAVVAETYRTFPRMNIQSAGYVPTPSTRYFS
jgi:hypothetical protein